MSEIDHPLLSEGICLPRMGYLRGDNVYQSCEDEEEEGDEGKWVLYKTPSRSS